LIVVGFDTATDDTAVCAASDGEVLYETLAGPDGGRPRHATALLPEVERAAAAAGGWEGVGRVAVGVGPGSFTGLRIGISTARALAASLGLPLAAVPTLAAIGRGLAERAPGRHLLPALDARRGEVFASLQAPGGEIVWPPFVAAPAALAERLAALPEPPLAAGSGAVRFRAELTGAGAEVPAGSEPLHRISGRHVCAIGAAGAAGEPEAVEPTYLRPPDAERWRDRQT
jgi:tRNA threonylcarbamoyladenosine biosynthesis protein TsaB